MTDWRGWLITDEQAELIRGGDIPARNRFYFENLARIKSMARNYVHKMHFSNAGREYDIDDCINGLYLDLSLFDFGDGLRISWSVRNSFYFSIYGGWLYVVENNSKLRCGGYRGKCLYILDSPAKVNTRAGDSKDTGDYLIDSIASTPSPESEIIDGNGVAAEKVVEIAREYLSPRETEIFSLMLDGYSIYAIPEILGLKGIAKQYARIKARLCVNYESIIKALQGFGAVIPRYARLRPEKYEKSVEMLAAHNKRCSYSSKTPEQKAKYAEYKRQWRAKQKALKNKGQQNVAL